MRANTEVEFWARVRKTETCWLWTTPSSVGYGIFSWNKKVQGAHRVSWQIHNGPIPNGLWVLHKCDVRACVNPEHLFLGTPFDNTHDMINKGRAGRRTKTSSHCRNGHEFTPENTRTRSYERKGRQLTDRHCKTCNRNRIRQVRQIPVEKWRVP